MFFFFLEMMKSSFSSPSFAQFLPRPKKKPTAPRLPVMRMSPTRRRWSKPWANVGRRGSDDLVIIDGVKSCWIPYARWGPRSLRNFRGFIPSYTHLQPWLKKWYMGVSENSGFSPQIIHFSNFSRVFHNYFHHPIWGTTIFGNTYMLISSLESIFITLHAPLSFM